MSHDRTDACFKLIRENVKKDPAGAMVDALAYIALQLDDLNSGVSMLLNNDPSFVTSGHLADLQSVVSSILTVLEERQASQ